MFAPATLSGRVLVAALALALSACSASPSGAPSAPEASGPPVLGPGEEFLLTSESVAPDGELADTSIGSAYVFCDGPGRSPGLSWSPGPEGTVAFAVKFENITVPFIYWLEYDIPPTTLGVAEQKSGALGGIQGRNSVTSGGFIAPCPEPDETHDFLITVYALDIELGKASYAADKFDELVAGHILAEAKLEAWKSGPPSEMP